MPTTLDHQIEAEDGIGMRDWIDEGDSSPVDPLLADQPRPAGMPIFEALPPGSELPPPTPPAGPTSGSPARSRRRWVMAVGAMVVTAALAGGVTGWASARVSEREAAPTTTAAGVTQAANLTLSGTRLDVAGVLAKVGPSVVSVQTQITQQRGPFVAQGEGAGTGIILSADGEVLTNAHVVADATSITVTLPGETTARTAQLVGSDAAADVALLRLRDVSGLTPAPIGDSTALKVGDDVVAIGNALALDGGPTVTKGIVSALDRSIATENGTLNHLIQTDAAISSGNSGGPLVNAEGQVIGLNTAAATSSGGVNAENIGFAIPIATAQAVVQQLRTNA